MKTNQSRLLALDVMRGMTIAGMILVNNAGSWSSAYEPLRHASWNGLTPTDLVFPFFMFIMGVSTYFSLNKSSFAPSRANIIKIVKRALIIFIIGLGLTWLSRFLYGVLAHDKTIAEAANTFSDIRILGVLQRLALSYGLGALMAVTFKKKRLPWIAAILLVGYAIIMWIGNGYLKDEDNIVSRVDLIVLGAAHMYTDTFDPEGLLSTLPSIAHVLIGFMCGSLILGCKDRSKMMNNLFIVGAILTFTGLLFSYMIPLNKKVWSPTFVLTTCGLASTLLSLLIWIIDVKGKTSWTPFFRTFGINPLYLYVQSAVLAYLFGAIRVHTSLAPDGICNLKSLLYYSVLDPLSGGDAQLASLYWALLFVLINWLPGYWLQRRGIIIKI